MSDYSINVPILVVLFPQLISLFLFIAANLKPLTIKVSSHQHNSSTVPLNTPTLWSTPSTIHTCSPIPSLENLKSEAHVSILFWNNVILRHNITCTTIICHFDLCCTVTCVRHYTHISRLFTYSHKHNIQPNIATYFKYNKQ